MSYAVVVSPAAAAQLAAIPPQLSQFIYQQLDRLKEQPTALSCPTTLLQSGGQLFEAKFEEGGIMVWISIIFRFGQDEQTLHVEHIAWEFG